MSADPQLRPGPPHLNPLGCLIKVSDETGRGVYASCFIPRNTLVEVSPVLLFSKEEYQQHGKHTVLDHYTFNWPDGRMALALGLGSLFNHSEQPNVTFKLDTSTGSIHYTTSQDVEPDQELCIFYGHNLWFEVAESTRVNPRRSASPVPDDGWGGLSALDEDVPGPVENPYAEGNPDEIIPEDNLPFTLYKLPPEEEEPGSVRTTWVVDIPDQRHITTLLKWLKQEGLDGPELGHLKRVRKTGQATSMLLSPNPEPPVLPPNLDLPAPYQLSVPASSALTAPSLALKSAIWPTIFTPRRKDEAELWTRGRLRWAWDAMKTAVDKAILAKQENELPIASHIPPFYDPASTTPDSTAVAFTASDTRHSLQHPLKHSAINTIRQLADYHASLESTKSKRNAVGEPSVSASTSSLSVASESDEVRNGTNYLLTDKVFFTTHEPCIMCSMSLLHSRVKDLFYLYPMEKTGGCGGCACLPTLKGVNHRFNIFQWKLDVDGGRFTEEDLSISVSIDA